MFLIKNHLEWENGRYKLSLWTLYRGQICHWKYHEGRAMGVSRKCVCVNMNKWTTNELISVAVGGNDFVLVAHIFWMKNHLEWESGHYKALFVTRSIIMIWAEGRVMGTNRKCACQHATNELISVAVGGNDFILVVHIFLMKNQLKWESGHCKALFVKLAASS